jgi:hypothetical protein
VARAVVFLDLDRVSRFAAELERGHLCRTPDLAPFFSGHVEEALVELRASSWKEGVRASCVGPGLGRFLQARHLVVDEPEPEGLLGKLLAREVVVLLSERASRK